MDTRISLKTEKWFLKFIYEICPVMRSDYSISFHDKGTLFKLIQDVTLFFGSTISL